MLLRKSQGGLKRPGKNRRKKVLILFFIGLFLYFFALAPILSIGKQAKDVEKAAKEVKAAFYENDLGKTEQELQEMKAEFNELQRESKKLYWARFIPLLGYYVSDYRNVIEAGGELIEAGLVSVDAIEPYADLLGFKKGEGASFIERPAEERLQTAILTLDKIVTRIDDIAVHVDKARDHIDQINPSRYPKSIAGKPVRPRVEMVRTSFDGVASLFVDAKPFLKKLPDILGADKDKTYLILFQNDNELRPTGGFLTAYAVFKVHQGKFEVVKSADIYSLDASIKNHPAAPYEIATYHKGVSKLYIRDSNLSPDYPTSIKLFEELYEKSSERVDYDGIIALDTEVLVDALAILGDTQVRGKTFSSVLDKRCDCPQVIYTLLDEIDRPVAFLKADRKGILGDLLFALMQKALGSSPSQYWGQLSQMMIKNMREKHALVYLVDKEPQRAMENINFAGRVRKFDGDYLHINDTNFAGAKSNLYVQHFVISETEIKRGGQVERTVTVTYKNPKPHSNCDLEEGGGLGRGGLCINATLRNWIRVYVPEGSKLGKFIGSETKVRTYDELGYTVYEGFLRVQPMGKASVTVTYTLPFDVKHTDDYRLMVQKQPGTDQHEYTVKINGKTIETYPLVEDKIFKSE